jgi:hypothetical protein
MTESNVVVEGLRKARALYASAPSHVGRYGCPEDNTYCIITALEEAGWIPGMRLGLYAEIGAVSLIDYNAEHSTEEVLAVFDRAIERETAVREEAHD